ncbi:hypothetical protein [Rhizobium aouanii]|uniref:Uncharacterized protein n=1 Tax=Rhizobium aouanii TaxID=3118145 RepID=A0ABU8CU80_9HYPH
MEFSFWDCEVIRGKEPQNLRKVPFGDAIAAGNYNGIDLASRQVFPTIRSLGGEPAKIG